MDSAVKVPLSERISIRMIVFFTVLAVLIGYPTWIYVDSAIHGGRKQLAGGYTEVDLKAMSVFPFDQVSGTIDDVPAKWRELEGKKIVAYGEMWEPRSAGHYVDSFDLVYSIAKCCFSGPPQIQHFVQSRVVSGKVVGYHSGPVEVTGTLHVKVTRNELGKITGVYHLDVETVRPVS